VLTMVRWETFEGKRGATPVYRQLADFIAGQIEGGHLEAGAQIPAERRLAELVGVSVDTVRAAVAALREAGLVETGHGTGTFVK
jgi:GntR family transcriptional regulator